MRKWLRKIIEEAIKALFKKYGYEKRGIEYKVWSHAKPGRSKKI